MTKDETQLRLHAFLMQLCQLCHEHRLCLYGQGQVEFYLPEQKDCRSIEMDIRATPTEARMNLWNVHYTKQWLGVEYKHLYHYPWRRI